MSGIGKSTLRNLLDGVVSSTVSSEPIHAAAASNHNFEFQNSASTGYPLLQKDDTRPHQAFSKSSASNGVTKLESLDETWRK